MGKPIIDTNRKRCYLLVLAFVPLKLSLDDGVAVEQNVLTVDADQRHDREADGADQKTRMLEGGRHRQHDAADVAFQNVHQRLKRRRLRLLARIAADESTHFSSIASVVGRVTWTKVRVAFSGTVAVAASGAFVSTRVVGLARFLVVAANAGVRQQELSLFGGRRDVTEFRLGVRRDGVKIYYQLLELTNCNLLLIRINLLLFF